MEEADAIIVNARGVRRVVLASLDQVGREIYDTVVNVAAGEPTKSEALGHREFLLT